MDKISSFRAKICPKYGAETALLGEQKGTVMIIDRIALIIAIIGTLNWGSVGLFQFDLVAWACGGVGTLLARIIYTVVALAGIWCISLLFRSRNYDELEESDMGNR